MTSLGWSFDDKNHDGDVKNDDDKIDDVISVLFRRKRSGLEKHRPVLDSISFLLQIAVISGYGLSARNENWISVSRAPSFGFRGFGRVDFFSFFSPPRRYRLSYITFSLALLSVFFSFPLFFCVPFPFSCVLYSLKQRIRREG